MSKLAFALIVLIDGQQQEVSYWADILKMFKIDETKFIGKLSGKLDANKKRQSQERGDYLEMISDLKNNTIELKNKLLKITEEEKQQLKKNNSPQTINNDLKNTNNLIKQQSQVKIENLTTLNLSNEKRIKELIEKTSEEQHDINAMTEGLKMNSEKIEELQKEHSQSHAELEEKNMMDVDRQFQRIDQEMTVLFNPIVFTTLM
jgi:hypothetical protein